MPRKWIKRQDRRRTVDDLLRDLRQAIAEGRALAAPQDGHRLDNVNRRAFQRAEKGRAKVAAIRDRHRVKHPPVPTGEAGATVPAESEGTIFPSKVADWTPGTDEPILKDGANIAKIGGDVLVGRLRGAKIFTLTLEERATCPRSCIHWQTCMGNRMVKSRRWRDSPAFRDALMREVDAVCAEHDKVLIRLHILGDFIDAEYLDLWRLALARNDNLSIFGFTAHEPGTPLGDAIARMRDDPDQGFGLRFAVRHSGREGRWGSTVIDHPTEARHIDRAATRAVVCPEQVAAMNGEGQADHCGACGLCWKGATEIVFVQH